MKNQVKTMGIWRKIIVCLMAAMLLLTFAACGNEPAQQQPEAAVEGESEQQLRQQLINEDVTEIIVQGTLYLSAPVEVVGDKTITGEGKIVAKGEWAEDDYLIRVASGTELVLAGTVTVDGKGISGGVYVSEGAALQVTGEATVRGAAEELANVLAAGAVQISGGFLSDAQGDNVRVTGTLEQSGGTISGGYNNVSVAAGASFVWNAGSNLNAKNDGVLIAEGADLKVTSVDAILKDAGAQGIHLEGKATIDGVLITGCQENQIKIEESAELTVNECTLSGSMGHGITNRGKLTMNAGDITGAVSCGIVNTGALEVNGGGIRTNGNKGILVKNGGSLVIASENVAISGNVVGVAIEENATADISKAKVNSNTLNNISCFGELYIHDIIMGGSGSNCIATNYGGHVVAKNMEIISTNGNNGIYNINGSLVELTDCIISGTKTNAIRNLDADLVGTNVTISNCGGGISTGDYIFGETGSVKITNLTTSGITGSNVSTEAYCGGTIELINAKLGATGSNNLSIKGGHLILTNAVVDGNRESSSGTTHGILMDEGGKITATDVTISNTKVSAIRNRGGYFEGTNITLTKIGEDGISNVSHSTTKAPGVVIIRNLITSYVGKRNIENNSKGGTVSISGGYLCQTADNNIRNVNGTTVLNNVTMAGTVAKWSDNLYGFMITGGTVKATNVEVGPCYAAAIRAKGGDFKGTDITVKGGLWFAWNSKGDITVNGLTTENVTESNIKIDADDATISITNGKLCATESNNIRIFKGVVSLKNTDVAGQTDSAGEATHGVLMTGGELKVDNVTIHDTLASGIRNRGGVLTGKKLSLKDIGASGISATKEGDKLATVNLDGLVTENVGAENVTADAGTVTLTNATLGVSGSNSVSIKGADLVMSDSKILGTKDSPDSNLHGIMVTSGSAKLENIQIQDVDMAAIRISGGTIALNNISVNDPGKDGINASGGTVTGKNLVLEGVVGYGVYIDKNTGDVSIDGLKINASGSTEAYMNVSAEAADYKGNVTLKNAVLGKTQSNNVALKAANAKIDLTDVEILGTTGSGAHGIYVTAGAVTGDSLTITDSVAGLRVNGTNAVVDVKNSTITGVRDNGVTQTNGTVTLTNVTIDSPTNYGATVSGGTISLNSVIINAPQKKDGISVSGGAASLNGVTVNTPKSNGITVSGGAASLNGVTVNTPKNNGITVSGGSITGKDVVLEGVTSYGLFIDKNAGDVSVDGLKINASGSTEARMNVSAEAADYKGTVTLKNAVLGKTQSNNVALKAANAKIDLTNVEILGTTGSGAHSVYVTAGAVTGDSLTITDSVAGLRVNGTNAVVDVKNSTITGVRDNGVTQTNGTVTLTNVTIDSPTNYGATISGGTIALNSVIINAPQKKDGISVSGGAASLNGVTVNTPKSNGISLTGGSLTGKNVVIEGVTAYGINVGKSAGDISITGLSINAPDAGGKQSAQATTNLQVEEGYSKTITLSGTAEADAVLGKTASNNIRTYSGKLVLNHVDIMGTAKDNAICSTATGIVEAEDLEVYGAKGAGLRFKDASAFIGKNVAVANCDIAVYLHGSGTHSVTGLNVTGSTGNNILLESSFTGTLTVNGTAEKYAYLGTSPSHSIRLYGGTINLNNVEIAGTSVNAIHGILSDKTTINATNLTIHDTKGSGLRLRDNTTFTGTNITMSAIAADGISLAGGKVEITGLKITSAGGYGIDNSATLTLKGTNNTISGCGNLAVQNNANKTITVEGGAITGNVDNKGTMTMNASVTGSVTNSGTLTQNAAVTGTVVNSGEFTVGAVSIKGDITNTGTLTATGTTVTGNVSNSSTLTMTNATVNGAVSNSNSLTISKVYIRDGLYSTTEVTFTGSETAHTAADPMVLTVPEANIVAGTVLVRFDDEAIATALAGTFTVPAEYEQIIETSVYHDSVLEISSNALRLYKDMNTYYAQVNGGNKYRTLAEAVAYAVTVSDAQNPATVVLLDNINLGSTITVPAGANIIITDNGSAKTILRDAAGSWTATARGVMIDVEAGATLTLQGTGTDTLIIDGNKAKLAPTDANWVLVDNFGNVNIGAGVVLQNNKSTRPGAAVRVESGANLNVTGGKFLNNESIGQAGGAVYVNNGAKDISIQNAHFEGNEAGFHGGAISATSGNSCDRLFVKNCTFTNNLSGKNATGEANGGAITTYGPATIESCSFTGNDAVYGGAINGGNGSVIGITGCTFTGNTSTQRGGAVNGAGNATLNISNCTFTGNIATGNGGAVSIAKGTITGSNFSGNQAAQGGAINSNAGQTNGVPNLTITNCSITGNKAQNGGGINAATGNYITLDGCTVTGNDGTNSDPQGENIRLAGNGGTSKVVVKASSQATVLDVHMQAASYVTVSGSLKDGSQITLNWPIYSASDNRVPVNGTAVKFDSAEIAKNNFKYFTLSDALTQSYHLALDGDKIIVKEGAAVARVDGVVYGTLEEAISVAATSSIATGKAVTVEVIANSTVAKTITIPENANIIITDDGVARTISRSADFDKTRGVMFDVINSGASLTFTSTSGSNDSCKLIIDGANQNFYSGNCAIAVVRAEAELIINAGVKLCNNYSGGAGGVIRVEGGVLTVNGGVFTGNNVVNNGAGVINVLSGAAANISNAAFTSNHANGNGGVIGISNGASVSIQNCAFTSNSANGAGGVMEIGSKTKGNVTITGCTFTGNSANKGGVMTIASDCIATIKDCSFSGNSANSEGNDIRLGGAGSKVYLSGKVVTQIHNQNASTVYVEGTLAADSLIVSNWLVNESARIPAVAVQFDSAEALAASWKYIRLSDSVSASHHFEVANEKTLVLVEGAEVARVEGIGYDSLDKAVAAAATSSIAAGKAVTVEVIANAVVTKTITIPKNANIIITDDGNARKIIRGTNFSTTARGVLFDISDGAKVKVTSTGTDNAPKLIFDGNKTNIEAVKDANWAIFVTLGSASNLTVEDGVQFINNSSTGAGGVLRIQAGTLTITGGVFSGNKVINNGAGVINVMSGAQANISNATFTSNSATSTGGVIIVQNGARATIRDCVFTGNRADSAGGVMEILSKTKGHVTIEGCTFTGNSAGKGGAVTIAGDCIAIIKDCTFANNSASAEGNDIRLGGAGSKVYLSGKVVTQIHNQNASTVYVEGTLTEGSMIVCNWLVNESARIPAVAVQFDSAEALAANRKYVRLSATANMSHHFEVANENTLILKEGAEIAKVGDVIYTSLEDAITAAGNASSAENPVTVEILNNVAMPKVIYISGADKNIIIKDDGVARKITRASDFAAENDGGRRAMFGVQDGAKLTFAATGTDKLIIDGEKSGTTPSGNRAVIELTGGSIVNINSGVVIQNNKSTGAGSAARVHGGSVLNITGAKIQNNETSNNGGAIYVADTNSTVNIYSGTTFTGNKSTGNNGGAINAGAGTNIIINSQNAPVTFSSNSASKHGGAIYTNGVLTITGTESNKAIFTGNSGSDSGAISAESGSDVDVTYAEFKNNTVTGYGGAVGGWGGAVDISNSHFEGNSCGLAGGATLTYNKITFNLTNCTFYKNNAGAGGSNQGGGAIAAWDGTTNVSNCTFTENTSKNGGAIHINANGTLIITGGSFSKNKATSGYGGAIAEWGGTLNATGVTFTGNTATVAGGAVLGYKGGASIVNLTNCIFTNNTATKEGGALAAWESTNTVTNCTFTNNSGTQGGAIHMNNKTTSKLVVSGGTFTGNKATSGEGGAIYASATNPQVEISGVAFNQNSADKSYGGAIFAGATYGMPISDCTFTGNTASLGGGAITVPGGSYVILHNVTCSGNSANQQGNDVRLGGATSKVSVSGKIVAAIHNQNTSTVTVTGTLSAGSSLACDWQVGMGRIPTVAVKFDNADAAAANMPYISVGDLCTAGGYGLTQNGATAVLYQPVASTSDEISEDENPAEESKESEQSENTPAEENEETAEGENTPADVNEDTAEGGNAPAEPQE